VYSLKQELRQRLFFTLRTTIPIVLLAALLAAVAFLERRSFVYNLVIFGLGIFAALYYIYYMIFSDVRKKVIDDITGAFERTYFLRLLSKHSDGWLLLLSIDNIKEINERYGFENGDKILRRFAKILDGYFQQRCGREVPIARFKSGDFLVLLDPECDAQRLLEDFLRAYDNTFINNIEIKLFGAVTPIESGHKPQQLIDRLYEDIYYCKGRCKQRGKREPAVSKLRSGEDFDRLIIQIVEQERLTFLFQPALNLHTRSFDLVELIVKLVDEEGQLIHPSKFIPAINRLGLENRFDIALVRKLLRTIGEYRLPRDIAYSFNISPYSIRNRAFERDFKKLFAGCSIPKESFVIKLYESSVYKDLDTYAKIIEGYRKDGFRFGFDNFGACNAAIEYIKEIDVDYLFFDKLFTKHIDHPRYGALLRSWIEFAGSLGVKSVVKFVDDPQKVELFAKMGADYVSGYGVARPMPADQLAQFLKESDAIR